MGRIEAALASIKEDHRSDYLWPTKTAAEAVRLHANKFGAWWKPNRQKLIDLMIALPGETAAELAVIVAEGIAERERRGL